MGSASSLSLTEIHTHIEKQTVDSSEVCIICNEEGYGVTHCDKCDKIVCSNCCSHQPRKRNPLYGKQLNLVSVKTIPDEAKQEYKRVRCGCFTHEGNLALVCCYYHKDKKCKCCDTTSHWKLLVGENEKIISDRLHDIETERHPGDMTTSIVNKRTYMTSPFRKTVYKISSNTEVHVAFETAGKCYGIACFDNGLAVSVFIESDFNAPAWQVQYLQFDGSLKKRITVGSEDSAPLFSNPRFLSSNLSEKTLFVSDSNKFAIIALNIKGEVLYKYTDSKIKNPRGITVDSENNVYVADGHTVVQIEAGGKDSNTILDTSGKNIRDDVVDVIIEPKSKSLIVIQSKGTVTTFSF